MVHPNELYSHGRDSLVGVLFSCILHHVLYCTIYLSRTITRLKMYLVISCGIKYKKISLSLSAFCILCYAGRFIPPRFSSLHSAPCQWGHTLYTDWALPGDPSTWSRSSWPWGYWHRAGQPHPMPEPAARRTSPIKHCQVAYTLKTYSSMSLMAIPNVHIGNITQNIPLSRYSFV